MKHFFLPLVVLVSSPCAAQSAQSEINQQVWKPFLIAFNDLNTDAFMAVHSKDVVRASRDNGQILDFDEYSKSMASGNQNSRAKKIQRKLELRFTERWVNNDVACEVGIYKSQTIRPTGESSVSYGKFQVILRKENNIWKILVDSDSDEGGTIGEKDYLSAKAME